MDDSLFSDSSRWLDWVAVFGYIGFAALITWKVFTTKPRD